MLLLALALVAAQHDDRGLGTTTPGWKPPYNKSRLPELLRMKCQADWPNDYSMQETCLNMQIEGAFKMKVIDERYGSKFNKQVETCVDDWTKAGVPDFSMIATCATMQIESYQRLNPRSP